MFLPVKHYKKYIQRTKQHSTEVFMKNLTKDELHKLCIETAAKSPCSKRKVGAVLANEVYVMDTVYYKAVATGYNHNPDGTACECENGNTKDNVVHAEVACIQNYLQYFTAEFPAHMKMYCTHEPCNGCKAALLSKGIAYEVVGEFMKFDKSKLRMSLVPASLAQSCARALQYGARKYKVGNWRKTPDIESYISAMQRHFDAWREGEENDAESGLSHLDHMAANLCFLIELKHLPKLKGE